MGEETAASKVPLPVEGNIRKSDGAYVIKTTPDHLVEVAHSLKNEGYTTVVSLSAVDYPKEGKLTLIVHVTGYALGGDKPKMVEIQVDLPRDEPRVPTLTGVWTSADFQEREAFEMFGIIFEGHPDLRHILLDPEEYKELRPLRKDFVVKEENIMLKENWGDYRG